MVPTRKGDKLRPETSNEYWQRQPPPKKSELAGRPSPIGNDATGSTHCYAGGDHSKIALKLPGAANLASYPEEYKPRLVPTSNEAGDSCNSRKTRLLVSGEGPNGSSAPTGKRGQLNPGLSRWMQGLPISWDMCALVIERSSRRSSKTRKTG
jgi:hypothetical protein